MSGWRLQEYLCKRGHRTELLRKRDRVPKTTRCDCGARAERVISAIKTKTVLCTAVNRGKSDPPPHHLAMDSVGVVGETRTEHEWSEGRKKKWREFDRKRRRARGAPI